MLFSFDSVPVKILKDHFDVFIPKVVLDFDSIIRTGAFTNKLELAKVTPIFKKNDKLNKRIIEQSVSYLLKKLSETHSATNK